MSQDTVRFCPQCGSAGVDFSALANGAAHCRGCGWKGTNEDLLLVPIQHDFAFGSASIITEMMNDARQLLAGELGLPYLKFLLKWGFIEGGANNLAATLDRKMFARYLSAIGHAVLNAVLAERMKQSDAKSRKDKDANDAASN